MNRESRSRPTRRTRAAAKVDRFGFPLLPPWTPAYAASCVAYMLRVAAEHRETVTRLIAAAAGNAAEVARLRGWLRLR